MILSALSLLLAAPSLAAPGDHIRAGDAVVVPEVDVGMEYRTNVFRTEADGTPGANLRLSPGVDIDVDNPMNQFKLGGEWELRKFIFVGDDGSGKSASERNASLDQSNQCGVNAILDALKHETVGLQLRNVSSVRNNLTDAAIAASPFNTRIRNNLGGGLRISPGQALAITPGAVWVYDDFRTAGGDGRRYNQRSTYGPNLESRWDFFPRTALVLNGSYLINDWSENSITQGVDPSLNGGLIETPNSSHLKFETGLSGRFSTKLFLDLLLGYGAAVYEGSDKSLNVSGLQGTRASVQLRYVMSDSAQASVGYKKDFTDSFFTNYIAYNNVYAMLQGNLSGFRPSMKYSYRSEAYNGLDQRQDILMRFDLNMAYDMRTWASLNGGFGWQQRASSVDTVEYDDLQVRVFGTFKY